MGWPMPVQRRVMYAVLSAMLVRWPLNGAGEGPSRGSEKGDPGDGNNVNTSHSPIGRLQVSTE